MKIKLLTLASFFICAFYLIPQNTYSQENKDYKAGMQVNSYSKIKGLNENLWAIQINNKWGVIDQKYVLTTPIIYEEIYSFRKGICLVKLEGKYGYIDKNGSFIIQPKYDDIFGFTTSEEKIKNKSYVDEDITFYKISDKQGYIDINGKEITQPIFSPGSDLFCEGVATVKKNNKWGLIDKFGNFIVPCNYKQYRNYLFNGYNAIAFIDEKGMCGFYNKDGKIIVPFSKKQIAENYEIGSTASNDQIPPVFKVNGKFELVKNIERLEPDFGLFMDENTINNKSFLSNYYSQKRFAPSKKINTNYTSTNSTSTKTIETQNSCNFKFVIPKITWKLVDNRRKCSYCRARYVPYSKKDIAEAKQINTVQSFQSKLSKHWEAVNPSDEHKENDREKLTNLFRKNNYSEIAIMNAKLHEMQGPLINNYIKVKREFFLDNSFNNLLDFSRINLYDVEDSKYCSRKCEREDY